MLKNSKSPPFHIFRHYETVQNSHFSSDIRINFFQYFPNFFKTGVFSVLGDFFSNLFLSLLRFLLETNGVASRGDSSGLSALCDLARHFVMIFFERFLVEQDGFLAVSSWGKMVFGYFWRCKIHEILTIVH